MGTYLYQHLHNRQSQAWLRMEETEKAKIERDRFHTIKLQQKIKPKPKTGCQKTNKENGRNVQNNKSKQHKIRTDSGQTK